jgi:hypothetical protein
MHRTGCQGAEYQDIKKENIGLQSSYPMFSGGEKNSFFCFVIGNGISATLVEKIAILPVPIMFYAVGK